MKRAPNARWTRIFGLAGLLTLLRRVRRRADAKELAIESREQLFSMLVRNADDIYVMFSPDAYEVEYVSPNVEKLLGVSVEAVKNNIRALSDSAADPSSDPRIDDIASLEEGECLQVFRERIQARTGERRWYQETLYRESIKGVDKYVLVLSDRTNEQKGSLMLEQALDIARSSNEAKSQFLANMSHDIRTPINAIVGMTKIARESGEASEKIAGCLDAITASSRHLLELINDVLDMSRIESGQMELQERRFDIDDVVGGVEAIIRPQAQAKSQELRIDRSKMKHKAFSGDELRISQILLNLASNAVKYTQEGGSIALVVQELAKTRPSYASVAFTITDNGMGMSPEFVERIFDPFERSEEVSIARIQGTGLGMSITKALIDAMGGIVEVDSEKGRGSSFRVTLELRVVSSADACPPLEVVPESTSYRFEGKRFLLAEDNELNAEILIELLGCRGAKVEWAENGEKGDRCILEAPGRILRCGVHGRDDAGDERLRGSARSARLQQRPLGRSEDRRADGQRICRRCEVRARCGHGCPCGETGRHRRACMRARKGLRLNEATGQRANPDVSRETSGGLLVMPYAQNRCAASSSRVTPA